MLKINHAFYPHQFFILVCESEEKYNHIHICTHTREKRDDKKGKKGKERGGENMRIYSSSPFTHIIGMFPQEKLYYYHFTEDEMEADNEEKLEARSQTLPLQ